MDATTTNTTYTLRVACMGVVEEFPVTSETTTEDLIGAAMARFSITRPGWMLMRHDGYELEAGCPVLPHVSAHYEGRVEDAVLILRPRVFR